MGQCSGCKFNQVRQESKLFLTGVRLKEFDQKRYAYKSLLEGPQRQNEKSVFFNETKKRAVVYSLS